MFMLAAISLGFLGSLHCIGMCGPIALALPVRDSTFMNVLRSSLLYNAGRAFTYAILGLLFGVLGQGFAFAGLQGPLSVAIGMLVFAYLLGTYFGKRRNMPFANALSPLRKMMQKLFAGHRGSSLFLIGLLNGLLPCGLVYLGMAGAAATGNALQGAAFMALFGVGTFPAMLAVGLARNSISLRLRERARRLVPVFAGIMAVLLIVRGLGLDIPYVSPAVQKVNDRQVMQCCRK